MLNPLMKSANRDSPDDRTPTCLTGKVVKAER